jgi:hypothetical protein
MRDLISVLEPVCSPSPNRTEARKVGLWLQLMCCTRSVIQYSPGISKTDIGRRPKLHNANEEAMGVF